MVDHFAIYKVPEGKLLKVGLSVEHDVITKISINGDFFAHPESIITEIENVLCGCSLQKESIIEKIENIVKETDAELYGLDAQAIAHAIFLGVEEHK